MGVVAVLCQFMVDGEAGQRPDLHAAFVDALFERGWQQPGPMLFFESAFQVLVDDLPETVAGKVRRQLMLEGRVRLDDGSWMRAGNYVTGEATASRMAEGRSAAEPFYREWIRYSLFDDGRITLSVAGSGGLITEQPAWGLARLAEKGLGVNPGRGT